MRTNGLIVRLVLKIRELNFVYFFFFLISMFVININKIIDWFDDNVVALLMIVYSFTHKIQNVLLTVNELDHLRAAFLCGLWNRYIHANVKVRHLRNVFAFIGPVRDRAFCLTKFWTYFGTCRWELRVHAVIQHYNSSTIEKITGTRN